MHKLLIGILMLLILAGFGVYTVSKQQHSSSPAMVKMTPTSHPVISPANTEKMNKLQLGGNSYLDEKGVYVLLYPNEYALDTKDPEHIRIYKRGDTERPQSEMSDGVLLVFESVNLNGETLSSWVDTRIKTATADGTSEIVSPKKAIKLNTYPGFSYTVRGLGSSQNVIIQKAIKSNTAVVITYSVSDPENKGYQKDVDTILTSLKLLK